jgi:4-hydroxybenzoyl-CoA thioesterase
MTRRIEWGDCDPAGIVFNPNFFSFFDHCTTMLYEAAGWPKHVMKERFGIAGCPLVEVRAKFTAPCAFGDDVAIVSAVAELRNSSFDIRHELRKGDKVCVEGFETRVWTVHDTETGRLRSAPIPREIVAAFQRNLTTEQIGI